MKNVVILGAGGFIGTNLTLRLAQNEDLNLTLIDKNEQSFENLRKIQNGRLNERVRMVSEEINADTEFGDLMKDQDIVYHLISSTNPSTSNQNISKEFSDNVIMTNNLLDSCVADGVGKVVFLSSGGTVYGMAEDVPLKEDAATYPISSYGLQKITIEKLLYLYQYLHGLDYRVIRLSNPYGPYQRPNGIQGVITTFTYKALRNEPITIYGDGSVVRDYIYIDDAVRGIEKIAETENPEYNTFNFGTGKGYSINELIDVLRRTLNREIRVEYIDMRKADVPVNILDISRYKSIDDDFAFLGLEEGILKTAEFLKDFYQL